MLESDNKNQTNQLMLKAKPIYPVMESLDIPIVSEFKLSTNN